MCAVAFSRWLGPTCLLALAAALQGQDLSSNDAGVKIYPAAMSMDYNPLLWRGDDAQFALETLHSSYCTAATSKFVMANTHDAALQTIAQRIAQEQGRLYRQLRGMARTFNFHLPPKRDLQSCVGIERISELSGSKMDSDYIALVLKNTARSISRFQEELATPREPENWTLWGLAKRDLPMIRGEQASATSIADTWIK